MEHTMELVDNPAAAPSTPLSVSVAELNDPLTLPHAMSEAIADYGPITFKGISIKHEKADFARVVPGRETSLDGELAAFVQGVWRVPSPGLLLRVTGNVPEHMALDASFSSSIDTILDDVFRVAEASNAWIITQGLDVGVASLVGKARDRLRDVAHAPDFGISDWNNIEHHDQLLRTTKGEGKRANPGAKRAYNAGKPDASTNTEPLEPHHRYFIFLGSGSSEDEDAQPNSKTTQAALHAWGQAATTIETDLAGIMRTDIAGNATRQPRVVLVFGGDEHTLDELIAFLTPTEGVDRRTTTLESNRGVIVLACDTGGLAAALHEYSTIKECPEGATYSGTPWAALKDKFDQVLRLARQGTRRRSLARDVSRTSWAPDEIVHEEGTQPKGIFGNRMIMSQTAGLKGLFDDILDAVLAQANDQVQRISTCVLWNDADRLRTEISLMPAWSQERAAMLTNVLQHSLELQHAGCVKVAMQNAASVKPVKLLSLYEQLFDTEYPPRFYLFEGKVKPTLALEEEKNGYALLDTDAHDSPEAAWELINEHYPKDAWSLLSEVVPSLCKYWEAKAVKYLHEGTAGTPGSPTKGASTQDVKIGCRALDLYVWAVLLGNTDLALTLLPFCQEPMRAAIVGARLCQHMVQRFPLDKQVLQEARDAHERFAIDLLELCGTFLDARRMLATRSQFWNRTVLEMAVASDLLEFCKHRYPQTLCDEMLRGNTELGQSVVLENRLTANAGLAEALTIIARACIPLPIPGIFKVFAGGKAHSMFALGWVKHQTSYLTQEEVRLADAKPLTFGDFYNVPLVRQLFRLAVYLLYVCLYSYIVIARNTLH